MANKLKFPLLLFLLFLLHCNLIPENTNIFNPDNNNIPNEITCQGLCIYPTTVEHTSDLTYQNFDVNNVGIIDSPIINYNEIISYDTSTHTLELTFSRDSLRNRIGTINVHGNPFLVLLDSEKIYGGWFWISFSSVPCHWIVINTLPISSDFLKADEIRISPGYPTESFFTGEDPRKNRKIIDRLIKDGKAK